MELFKKKTKKTEQENSGAKPEAAVSASAVQSVRASSASVLLMPRITEKGAYVAETGCYVFNVRKDANKQSIAAAVAAVFGVMPRKVTVAPIVAKRRTTRGTNRKGSSTGGKKAYVYLKKGDKIELV